MFESMVANRIAQRKKKIVMTIVPGSEQLSGLGHQLLEGAEILRRHGQVGVGVGHQIHHMDGCLSRLGQFNLAEMNSGDQGRIDERRE
jgi:pyridoxal biosynthesis lyase PdxS